MYAFAQLTLRLLTDQERQAFDLCNNHWFYYLAAESSNVALGIIPVDAFRNLEGNPELKELLCAAADCQKKAAAGNFADLPPELINATNPQESCEADTESKRH